MLLSKVFLFIVSFAACIYRATALTQEPMGVTSGATFCTGMDKVPNNGFNPTLPMTPIPSFSLPKENPDKRRRWKVDNPNLHGYFTILQANRDAKGLWQNHLKIHQDVKNWTGYLIVKASYAGGPNSAKIDHFFAIGMDDDAGCVLTTGGGAANYPIDWSYQLNGHKLRRE